MLRRLKQFENLSVWLQGAPVSDTYGSRFKTIHMGVLRPLFVAVVCLLSVGCTVGPDFANPAPPNLQLDYLASRHVTSTSIDLGQWWQSFGDPKMNGLLDQAQAQNLTLREAYERIVEARANYRLLGGQLKPNGNLLAAYSYNKNSPNSRPFISETALNGDPFNLFDLGADAIWEIDLFGKIARQLEAADAELKFQENDFESIRQTLFADIVSSYLQIRLLQSQMVLTEQSLAIQMKTDTLVSERKEAGVSTELDQSQTESFQHRTVASFIALKQQLELEFNRLSGLMGQVPDSVLQDYVGVMPLPEIPVIPTVGLPADLLRRRPDVAREEMAVRAASAQIGVAEADLYPQLTLIGTIGVSATNPSGLFENDGLEFDFGPSFQWNIFHFGRIHDNIEIQEARFRQTIARYQESVLNAVREVEDSLVNHQGYLEQWQIFEQAVQADQRAVELSLERYKAGKANFQRVVDAQQQLLQDQQQSYQVKTSAIIQLVRLFKAAGGDWTIGAPAIGYGNQFFASEVPMHAPAQGIMYETPTVMYEAPTVVHETQPVFSPTMPVQQIQHPTQGTSVLSPPTTPMQPNQESSIFSSPTMSSPAMPTFANPVPSLTPDVSKSSIPAKPAVRQALNLPFGLNVR